MHCLPQRLKSTFLEKISNGGAPKGPAEWVKISINVDFSLWGIRATQMKILQYLDVGAPELPSNLSPIWLCPPCVFVDKHFKHWNNWNFKREAEADCCCQTQYWTPVIIRLVWLVLSALSRSQSLIFFSGREIQAWCGCLTCSAEWADWLIELLMLDLP